MNYAKIISFDLANGPGIRVSLFLSGCNFHCKGCFNQDLQDFDYGNEFTEKQKNIILEKLSHPDFAGLSILGGDPMCQDREGIGQLLDLCDAVHELGKTVWLWTGYTWDELMSPQSVFSMKYILALRCDFIVDGRFIQEEKSLSLYWKGSKNQRIIDVKKSIMADKVVEADIVDFV